MMQLNRILSGREARTTGFLLSPLVLIVVMVLTVATGHDLFYFSGEMPIVLGLCAPAAYLLFRWFAPWLAARVRPASRGGAVTPDQAAKSIS